jgi:hypothetical protein
MLRIEVDMFSGRPNPVWILTDPDATAQVLDAIADAKGVTARPGAGYTGLGFREVRVELLGDDEARRRGVPQQFALASTAAADLDTSGALARRVIESMPLKADIKLTQHELTPLDARLRSLILERLGRHLAERPKKFRPRRFHAIRCGPRSKMTRARSASTR